MFGRFEVYGSWLREDPAGFGVYILCFVVTALTSLILHECAHGYVALRCGDPTAKMMGRLSLNPLRHLDPLGTLFMVVLGFGWAKPVPVNPRNYRNHRRDEYLVSVAGIAVNLCLFLSCTFLSVLCFRFMMGADWFVDMSASENEALYANVRSIILYGGATLPEALAGLMAVPWLQYPMRLFGMMTQMNLALAIFNLLPIPPLDGWRLANNALKGRLNTNPQVLRAMQAALTILCLTGLLGRALGTAVSAVDGAVVRAFMYLL